MCLTESRRRVWVWVCVCFTSSQDGDWVRLSSSLELCACLISIIIIIIIRLLHFCCIMCMSQTDGFPAERERERWWGETLVIMGYIHAGSYLRSKPYEYWKSMRIIMLVHHACNTLVCLLTVRYFWDRRNISTCYLKLETHTFPHTVMNSALVFRRM